MTCTKLVIVYPILNKLIIADSNRFSYKADVNNDGTLDSVRYYLGNIDSG